MLRERVTRAGRCIRIMTGAGLWRSFKVQILTCVAGLQVAIDFSISKETRSHPVRKEADYKLDRLCA